MAITYRHGDIEEVLRLMAQLPELGAITKAQITARLGDNASLILIALHHDQPIAFKLGYALSEKIFYSWLGGVLTSHRRQGIANRLREWQEQQVCEHGYGTLQVKSMNKFPAMLQLLIASGYQICGYEDNGRVMHSKICFQKRLSPG